VALVTGVLLASGLVSCTSSQESYCSTLKTDQKRLSTLSQRTTRPGATGRRALGETVDVLADLRDRAPDDIHADWVTLVDAFDGLRQAIRSSGADPGDFRGGKRPAGVTGGQLRAVQQAAAELQATPVQQASKSIEQHASDVCKVDLGSELGGGG
jgi:hypothetical protein